jgi:hypothetical protein
MTKKRDDIKFCAKFIDFNNFNKQTNKNKYKKLIQIYISYQTLDTQVMIKSSTSNPNNVVPEFRVAINCRTVPLNLFIST